MFRSSKTGAQQKEKIMDLNLKELQEMNNAMKALEADIAELQEFNEKFTDVVARKIVLEQF